MADISFSNVFMKWAIPSFFFYIKALWVNYQTAFGFIL